MLFSSNPPYSELELLTLLRQHPHLIERLVWMTAKTPVQRIQTDLDAYKVVFPLLGGMENEGVVIVTLDAQNGVIEAVLMTLGTPREALLDLGQVFRWVLTRSLPASGVMAAHNHPSGSLEPSPRDRQITAQLQAGCTLFNLRWVGHLLITTHSFVWIQPWQTP